MGILRRYWPKLGIDHGGTEIHLQFDEAIEIGEIRGTLRGLGLADDAVQKVGGDLANEFAIRIQDASFGADEMRQTVETKLRNAFGEDWINGTPDFDAEVGARMVVNYTGDELPPQTVTQVLKDTKVWLFNLGKKKSRWSLLPGLAQQVHEQIGWSVNPLEVLSIDAVGPKGR